ncbi:Stoned B-like protein [Actinidia chinensis var. chinensis]|uniref:Stoned B-like protein n=1 Tax=Actinidia chinensis var. chinensis TaxID=1590841 RepID=A0A2R6QAW2_ACTCC|nr:Stoned B-like protein [Actinidia chinensis var. chinensis]
MASVISPPCPSNAFVYNASSCACEPGYLYNATARRCEMFWVLGDAWAVSSGVDNSVSFPETILSFDTVKKFTQSQAVFMEATLVLLASWLAFCLFVRFRKLGAGRSIWFQIRWWISRMDISFATRHWLDDQKVVRKRKTELGGTFSVASWILFIGLFAALLFQIIEKRTIEVHNVKATNAPDLSSFSNDMEFNITTISSMSCSHVRDIGTLFIGSPGLIDYRVAPLSTFANYSCQNTTLGPKIILKCNNCQLIRDFSYMSWQFVDLPNNPATAVGFQFNLSAKNHASRKHLSFVSGMLRNGSNIEDKPVTYRGAVPNILKFNLFPRIYRNLHDLKLIQPLFHEFLPGSSYSEINELQASLQSSDNGFINVTLYVNFLSAYIVEIDDQNIFGPVGFLADLGGLYCISIGIFFYLMVQCEYRIKKLRDEDSVMRKIRNRRKAQDRWDKLRKYVMYTWGSKTFDDNYNNVRKETCCGTLMVQSLPKNGLSLKRRQQNRMDTISFNRKVNVPSEKKAVPEKIRTQVDQSCVAKSSLNLEGSLSCSTGKPESEVCGPVNNREHDHLIASHEGDVHKPQVFSTTGDYSLPPPPSLEFKAGSEISMSDINKNFQSLYDYNVMLRERLVSAQCMLQSLTMKASSSGAENEKTAPQNNTNR